MFKHLSAQDVLALFLILGMVWRITINIVRAADKLQNHEARIVRLEVKTGITNEVEL